MPKPFITYDQQIELLKSKHLIISDEDTAKRVLAQIGYFSLIGGYNHQINPHGGFSQFFAGKESIHAVYR